MAQFGANAMNAPLKRVLMRKPDLVMKNADPKVWHYGPSFDPDKAALQHAAMTRLIEASGAEIHWLADTGDKLSDSVFTRDPSIITHAGAVILNMGKALRKPEPALHRAARPPRAPAGPTGRRSPPDPPAARARPVQPRSGRCRA